LAKQLLVAVIGASLQQQRDRCSIENKSANGETALTDAVSAGRDPRRPPACETCHRDVSEGADEIMPPRDRLTSREMQVATLVWEGLINRDIAKAIGTTEQVVKNYLRNTFDKLGVWSHLELALYVAGHGGEKWKDEFGSQPNNRTMLADMARPA
jgi:DNA-binding CsgD family transcriptional regulator